MQVKQTITTPFGISVFGSAVVRIEPDTAVIALSVSRVNPHPKEGFRAVREAARKIQAFLAENQIYDAGSSRIRLSEELRYEGGVNKFVGYRTEVDFRIVLTDLNRVEEILSGLVDMGVTAIHTVNFTTTRLKEVRAEARHQAYLEAREKAEVYCKAAGVEVGEVIHIEDVDPDRLERSERRFHTLPELQPEDEDVAVAFDPSNIVVAGAVVVAFKIRDTLHNDV